MLPCGGHGNVRFVKTQLIKSGYKTLTITDGDLPPEGYRLNKEVIELYADVDIINKAFNTHFNLPPSTKKALFARIKEKDDVVKKVLSSWAAHHLTKNHTFVKELETIIKKHDLMEERF